MSQIDLVYVHETCPKCGEKFMPLMAWVSPCDFDDDGHANGIEVSTITCSKCGELAEESDAICEMILEQIYTSHAFVEIGNIYSCYPERANIASTGHAHALEGGQVSENHSGL